MKKTVAFLITLSILCTSFVAYADTTSVTALLDPETGIISLSGSAVGTTTVRVTKAEVELESLSDSAMPTDIHQITTKGSLNYEFRLPSGSSGGRYVISITDKNGTDNDTIFYFDKEIAGDIVDRYLKGGISESEFTDIVTNSAGDLGIDTAHEDYSLSCVFLMYKLNNNYENYTDFYTTYNYSRAISSLNGESASEIENKLKKYQSTLGIDYSECYENSGVLGAAAKTSLCGMLSDMDYAAIYESAQDITGKKGFPAVFEALSALSAINTSEKSWKAFEKIYTIDFPFLKYNVVLKNSDYRVAAASEVFGAMLTKNFQTITDLKDNFNSSVKEPDISETTRPTSSRPSVSVPHTTQDTMYEALPGADAENAVSVKVPSIEENYAEYADVAESDWFYLPVSLLGGNGVVSGYENGMFYPQHNITRAEFTKLIVSAFSVTGKKTAFSDVSEADWYSEVVSNAAGAGIVSGYDGCFKPNDFITRQDAAVILYRVSTLSGLPYSGYLYTFVDMDDISVYALPAVGALYKNGIVKGVGSGRFMPQSNITRAEAVQLIYNAISDLASKSQEG